MDAFKYDRNLLVKNYEEALKDGSFKHITSLVEVDDEHLMKHTSRLKVCAREHENCKNCKSLYNCQNSVRGFALCPKKQGERVDFEYVACKYKRQALSQEEKSCDYYEMPSSLKNIGMKDILLDDKDRVPIIKFLKNFYDTFQESPHQKGLYLHGSFGSGKTFLICAMLNELAKKGVDICVVYYPKLLRSLKDSFATDFASRIEKLERVSVLFLDDIGAEAVTPWSRDEILGTILQYRMDASLPTFFTSNLTIEELEQNLSSTKNGVELVKARRIVERIKELSSDMTLTSKSRRGQTR